MERKKWLIIRCLQHYRRIAKRCCHSKKDLRGPFPSIYDSKVVESGWYDWWQKNGYFSQNSSSSEDVFSMALPPPNVTGTLHLGHALTVTVQDALVRWRRMCGDNVVWIPGSDHAGIATQIVVEKKLWAEKKTNRHEMGKHRFLKEVWSWRREKGDQILEQLRLLGASLDWEKRVFTMDEKMCEAVTEAFIQLFEDGLIYRKNSLINWCCHLHSAIADIEVERKSIDGATKVRVPGYDQPIEFGWIHDVTYKIKDTGKELIASTTRPETICGDVALAIHPEDSRYSWAIGKMCEHPLNHSLIPVVPDASVNRDFGTGVVKITPAHDLNDYEVGQRHGLPTLSIFTDEGSMTEACGQFAGLSRFHARGAILSHLKQTGLLKGQKEHKMELPICQRSGDVIEPMLKDQWFVSCSELARSAAEAVRSGTLRLHPNSHEAVWFQWMDNCREWCISRQIWWGHQIPAYFCVSGDSSQWVAARSLEEANTKAEKLLGKQPDTITRDEHVLDTWFSSALYPFASLGWPNKTDNLLTFYPLSLMETGHDILFFWVARMVMLGLHLTKKLPFQDVLLHGLICDKEGRKMSKSVGNVIDPMDVIQGASLKDLLSRADNDVLSVHEKNLSAARLKAEYPQGIPQCGADALRTSLMTPDPKGHVISFDVLKSKHNLFFCNKLWQATRFVVSAIQTLDSPETISSELPNLEGNYSTMDRWMLSRLAWLVEAASEGFSQHNLHLVTGAFQNYWYKSLCDVYLESVKPIIRNADAVDVCRVLYWCTVEALRVAHPILPFVTEELYQRLHATIGLQQPQPSIMIDRYPLQQQWSTWRNQELEKNVNNCLHVVTTLRDLRNSYNLTSKHRPQVYISSSESTYAEGLKGLEDVIAELSKSSQVQICCDALPEGCASSTVNPHTVVHMQIQGLVDQEAILNQLTSKRKKLFKQQQELKTKLEGNKGKRMSFKQKNSAQEKLMKLEAEIQQLDQLSGPLLST